MASSKPTIDLTEAIFNSSIATTKTTIPSSSSSSSSSAPETVTTCFIPCPQISLYLSPSTTTLGLCSICHTNTLTILPTTLSFFTAPDLLKSSALKILPCGHAACSACIRSSLRHKPGECPFCRFRFAYELCPHPASGQIVTRENVLAIPDTVPMGGKVADQCPSCREKTNRAANERILRALADEFMRLEGEYRGVADAAAAAAAAAAAGVAAAKAKENAETQTLTKEETESYKVRLIREERQKEAIRASLASLQQQFKLVTDKLSIGSVELMMLW